MMKFLSDGDFGKSSQKGYILSKRDSEKPPKKPPAPEKRQEVQKKDYSRGLARRVACASSGLSGQ
jgi:hypothetical protein